MKSVSFGHLLKFREYLPSATTSCLLYLIKIIFAADNQNWIRVSISPIKHTPDNLDQWFSTRGSRPPQRSLDDLPGVGCDLQKFVTKLSAYESFIQQCSQSLFYFNVNYWILSQVFCSDIMFLFPHHQLCVKQDFQFAGSSSDYLLPRKVHLVKVTTPLTAWPHL